MPWKTLVFDFAQIRGSIGYVVGIRQETAGLISLEIIDRMAFRPNLALRFCAIDAVHWPHVGVPCALQEQLTLMIVLDT